MNTFLLGKTPDYQVVAPCVIVKPAGGTDTYLYRGRVLPVGVSQAQIDHLIRQGMIRELGGEE